MASLSVVISAETADLHAKLALAQADVRAFNAETKAAAETMRTAGGAASSEMRAGLEQAAAASAGAQATVSGYKRAISEATEASGAFAHATTRSKTEVIILAHEMLQGRFTRIPGSLMVMSEGMRGLGPAALGAAAAVAALGFGIFEMARHAAEAGALVNNLQGRLLLLGRGVDLEGAKKQAKGLSTEFATSQADAYGVVSAIQGIPHATNDARTALERYAVLMSVASRGTLDSVQAADLLAKAVVGGVPGIERFGSVYNLFTADQLRALHGTKDATAATGVLLEGLGARFKTVQDYAVGTAREIKALSEVSTDVPSTPEQVKRLSNPTTLVTGPAPNEAALKLLDIEDRYNQDLLRTKQIKADIAALDTAIASGTGDKAALQAERDKAAQELASLQTKGGASQVEQWRMQLAQMQAASTGTHAQELAAEARFWESKLSLVTKGSKDEAAVETEIARTAIALNRERDQDTARSANAQTKAREREFERQMEIARKGAELEKQWTEAATRFNEEQAKQSARVWQEGFSEIDGATRTMFTDMLSRHESFSTAAAAGVQRLAMAWTEALADIMIKLAAFEALRAASGIGGFLGNLAGQGANALGGQMAVAPSQNAQGGVTPGTQATGLAAILPEALSRMLGVGGGAGSAGAAQQMLTQGMTTLRTALTNNTASVASDTAGLLANTTGVTSNTTGLLSSVVQGGEWVAGALGLTTATTAAAIGQSALVTAIFANTAALVMNTISNMSPAAMAGAGMIPMATGAWNIQAITPALLHPGEMVLPAATAALFRAASTASISGIGAQPLFGAAATASGAGGAGGGAATIAPSVSVTALDARSVSTLLNNPSIVRNLAAQIQRHLAMNPSKQGEY